jgi:hypothetical protein
LSLPRKLDSKTEFLNPVYFHLLIPLENDFIKGLPLFIGFFHAVESTMEWATDTICLFVFSLPLAICLNQGKTTSQLKKKAECGGTHMLSH